MGDMKLHEADKGPDDRKAAGGGGFEGEPRRKPALTEEQARTAASRTTPSAAVVHEAIRKEGEDELSRASSALAWSGFAAGLSMGFSLVVEGLLRAHLPDAPWRPLIAKLGYSVGFLIVVLGRQQLFTENTLTVVIPLLAHRSRSAFLHVIRLWAVVLTSNLLGALLFASIVGLTATFPPEVREAFTSIATEAMEGSAWSILLRAIFAGWLIALMVWLLPVAETGRVAVIVIITYVVGLAGLAHVIAGSVEALYAVVTGEATLADYLAYLVPTLVGNMIGGIGLVAALNHAQVVSRRGNASA